MGHDTYEGGKLVAQFEGANEPDAENHVPSPPVKPQNEDAPQTRCGGGVGLEEASSVDDSEGNARRSSGRLIIGADGVVMDADTEETVHEIGGKGMSPGGGCP